MASKKHCFIALPFGTTTDVVESTLTSSALQTGYKVTSAPMLVSAINDDTIGSVASADCLIADISQVNPFAFFLIGLGQAMGKGIILVCDQLFAHDVPNAFRDQSLILYSRDPSGVTALGKKVSRALSNIQKFPRRKNLQRSLTPYPFYIDWEKLSPADTENLCRELLSQMGFRNLEWAINTPEFDLFADLPKQDPDGFEYREHWFVSFGQRAPAEMLLDMATREPEYLLARLARRIDEPKAKQISQSSSPITLLIVNLRRTDELSDEVGLSDILRHRSKRGPFSNSVRVRIWNQNYVNSLVHRYPQIGYKYFSDEARLRSETRKSYEELYEENSRMSSSQTLLIAELKEEKNKRATAERDAVWKDISFSAAHKIGNPIFAVETDLDPLERRIKENRTPEALAGC